MSHDAHAEPRGFPKPHFKEYFVILVALTVLTGAELGVVYAGVSKAALVSALVLLAVSKAALVGLYYMHLKHETSFLRWTVAIPLSLPFFYALVLIGEAAWRLFNNMPGQHS